MTGHREYNPACRRVSHDPPRQSGRVMLFLYVTTAWDAEVTGRVIEEGSVINAL